MTQIRIARAKLKQSKGLIIGISGLFGSIGFVARSAEFTTEIGTFCALFFAVLIEQENSAAVPTLLDAESFVEV